MAWLSQKKSRYRRSDSLVESVGWFRVGTVDLYVWKLWLNRLDGMVKSKKSRYCRLDSLVESVGWFRVGTIDLYVWNQVQGSDWQQEEGCDQLEVRRGHVQQGGGHKLPHQAVDTLWQQGVHAHHQPRQSLLVPTVRPPEEILGHEKVQGQEGFLGHEEVPCHREVPNYEEVPGQQDPEREEFPGHEEVPGSEEVARYEKVLAFCRVYKYKIHSILLTF